jgi:hypothetical protein
LDDPVGNKGKMFVMTTNTNNKNAFHSLQADPLKDEKVFDINNRVYPHENHTLPMFEQFVTPPAHVWEKISKVLDQQDNLKNAPYLNRSVKQVTGDKVRRKIYYAAFAVTAISCLFLVGR